jgi:hypothetical protein
MARVAFGAKRARMSDNRDPYDSNGQPQSARGVHGTTGIAEHAETKELQNVLKQVCWIARICP